MKKLDLIKYIQNNLTDNLLKPKYRGRKEKYAGHCYVATECFYYLYGRYNEWKPYYYKYKNGETHWWLQKGSEIIDITASQLKSGFDYSKGKAQFFVNYPSKRCKILADKVIKDGYEEAYSKTWMVSSRSGC